MKSSLGPTQSKGKGNTSPAGCTTSSKPLQRDPASEHPAQPQTPPRPLASASRSPPGPRRPRCSPRRPRGLPGRPPPGGAPGAGPSLRRAGALGRGWPPAAQRLGMAGMPSPAGRRGTRRGAVSPGGAPRTRLTGGRGETRRGRAGGRAGLT